MKVQRFKELHIGAPDLLKCHAWFRDGRRSSLGPVEELTKGIGVYGSLWKWGILQNYIKLPNPPAPKVLGRDRPDGTRKRLQVYLGGGIFRPKPPVFDRSWRSPSKNTVKNSTEDTCSWTRPSKIGKRKVKKTRVFQLFDLNFWVCNIFFCGSAGGLARRRIFEFLDPFSDWFSSFCDSRNTGFYSVFLFSACLTASFKTSKNLVNYAVLCYGVNENIVNTSVFWRWLKNTVNYSVFGHLTSKTMVFAVVSASHRAKTL